MVDIELTITLAQWILYKPTVQKIKRFGTGWVLFGLTLNFQNKNLSKGSFMIYLVEDGNTYEMEQAEYSVTQLWSDIGGAGGNC